MKPLVAIHACHKYAALRQAQREGWVKTWGHLVDIKWFVGMPSGDEPGVVYVDCADGWNSLGVKTSAEARYAREHGYTNLFKCDDDTFVHVPRLLESGFEEHEYTGLLCHANNWIYAQGGAGYWMGPQAINIVADLTDEWWLGANVAHHHSEDVGVGLAMWWNKIGLKNDKRYYHGVTEKWGFPAPENDLITAHKCNAWRHQHIMEINV